MRSAEQAGSLLLAAPSPATGDSASPRARTGAPHAEAEAAEPDAQRRGSGVRLAGCLTRRAAALSGPERDPVAYRGPRWAPESPPPAPLGCPPQPCSTQLRHAPCGDTAAAHSDAGPPAAPQNDSGSPQLQRPPQFRGGAYTLARGRAAAGSPAPILDTAT